MGTGEGVNAIDAGDLANLGLIGLGAQGCVLRAMLRFDASWRLVAVKVPITDSHARFVQEVAVQSAYAHG